VPAQSHKRDRQPNPARIAAARALLGASVPLDRHTSGRSRPSPLMSRSAAVSSSIVPHPGRHLTPTVEPAEGTKPRTSTDDEQHDGSRRRSGSAWRTSRRSRRTTLRSSRRREGSGAPRCRVRRLDRSRSSRPVALPSTPVDPDQRSTRRTRRRQRSMAPAGRGLLLTEPSRTGDDSRRHGECRHERPRREVICVTVEVGGAPDPWPCAASARARRARLRSGGGSSLAATSRKPRSVHPLFTALHRTSKVDVLRRRRVTQPPKVCNRDTRSARRRRSRR